MSPKWSHAIVTTVFCCAAIACGGDGANNVAGPNNDDIRTNNGKGPGGDDADSPDMGGDDDAANDEAGDAAIPDADSEFDPDGSVVTGDCAAGAVFDQTITIDEAATGGQLYARTAWDTNGAWIVYNQPGPGEFEEEIFLARVGCKGTIDVGPMRISAGEGERNYAPVIASRGGVTHVAWVSEPAGDPQKRIVLRTFGTDGEPLLAAPVDITPSVGDVPVSPTIWEPDVAVNSDGTGAIVATGHGVGERTVYLQRYDAEGVATGDAVALHPQPGVNQHRPTIAAGDDGTLYIGWIRDRDENVETGAPAEASRAVLTSVPAGANAIFPASPVAAKPLAEPTDTVRISKSAGAAGVHFAAFDVAPNIVVRDATDFETALTQSTGAAGYRNFRPSIAGGDGGGVVTWYRYNQTPQLGELMFASFDFSSGAYVMGEPVHVATTASGIPPYGPAVTWVGEGVYFLVWSEGTSGSTATVRGRFVSVD